MDWYRCTTVDQLSELGKFREVKEIIEREIGCGIKVKARGWIQLKDFIDSFKMTVNKFTHTNENDIFTSEATKYIYILTQLDGKTRQGKLGLTPIHYKNKDLADKWRKNIAKIIHPDVCKNKLANDAMAKLNSIYRELIR